MSPGLRKRTGEEARAVAREASAPRANEHPAELEGAGDVPPEFRAALPCRWCHGDGVLDEEPVTGRCVPCGMCGGAGAVYVDVRGLKPWRPA